LTFVKAFGHLPIFSVNDVLKSDNNFDSKQLVYWQKKGYIQKLINRWYCFSDKNFDEEDLFFVANKIYSPSYISFESALGFYGLIPEAVYTITSATSLKTNNFKTPRGEFTYHKLKSSLMFGYNLVIVGNKNAKIAEPSKAILDFLYINSHINSLEAIEELRINKEAFKKLVIKKKLVGYSKLYKNKSLEQKIDLLLKSMSHA
jgi:predicted transcriptional regulator of viral defense system